MISIITCSHTSELPAELKRNIDETIGWDYEIVTVDNAKKTYNIFEAYNIGVNVAKGDILCFMHDDIFFRSKDWGKVVYHAFENKKCGLVGVIGCQFLSNKVQPWWNFGHHIGCITQGYIENEVYKTFRDGDTLTEESKEGAVVDGLWFCIRRELFDDISFDEKSFDSFHCYDVDICLQVLNAGYQVRVLRDIHIEHQSGGKVDDIYYEQLGKFVSKWKMKLPISRGLHWGRLGTILYQLYSELNNR